ncbi:MAG TPA: hypothetical protein PK765_04460 [bacterium]|nr:hypothetical protein [bacterium]
MRFPYDGTLVDTVCLGRDADIDLALDRAHASLPTTRAMSS